MKNRATRPTEMLAIKVPVGLLDEIRRAARKDDRPVSAFLRRHLAATFVHSADDAEEQHAEQESR